MSSGPVVEFRLQDTVVLKSGGPRMSVAGLGGSGFDVRYLCTWTDADGQAWHDWFGAATLRRATAADREQ